MYFHVGPPIRMPDTPQTQSQALLCCSLNLSVASGTSLFSERLYVAVATSRAFTRRASTFRRSSANDNNSLNGGFRQTMHGQVLLSVPKTQSWIRIIESCSEKNYCVVDCFSKHRYWKCLSPPKLDHNISWKAILYTSWSAHTLRDSLTIWSLQDHIMLATFQQSLLSI